MRHTRVIRCALTVAVLSMTLAATIAAQRTANRTACLTLHDQRGQSPIVGALLRPAAPSRERIAVVSDSLGRACLANRDTIALRIDALGFIPVDLALATNGQSPVQLYTLPINDLEPAWGQSQLVAALAESQRQPEIQRDTVFRAVLAAVARRLDSLPPLVSIARDTAGPVIVAYVDLSADGSYAAELRLRMTPARSAVLGITTQHCGDTCSREFDAAVSWVPRDGAGWQIDHVARKEAAGDAIVVALGAPIMQAPSPTHPADSIAPAAPITTVVRGMVRDAKGRPVRDIEVYSADGAATALTDSSGAYRLTLSMPPGGVLLSTRRIGWAPEFRAVYRSDGRDVTWSPALRSVAVLARQLVTATGAPPQLMAPRYANFLARRAKGVGQFFVTEEIWSAMSLGDMLYRARGFRPRFSFGNRIERIVVPNCGKDQSIGVYVDDIEMTGMYEFPLTAPDMVGADEQKRNENKNTAESILPQFVTSAIVGMELYHFRTEVPPEYARPYYCAVIALWTR